MLMTPLRGLIVLAVLASPAGVRADTVVVNFNAATPGGLLTAPYVEDGFTMTVVSGHYDIWSGGGVGGSRYLGVDRHPSTGGSSVKFVRAAGTFDLLSLVVQSAPSPFFGESQSVTSSAGGYMSLTTVGIQTFSGSAWQNLAWIRLGNDIGAAGPGFDNITFNTVVPVPAAGWLFGGALGLLGFLKRRAPRQAG